MASLAAVSLAACASPPREGRQPRPGEPVLAVATYNLNFGLAGDPATLAAIGATEGDVVLLQETTPEWEAAIRAEYGGRYETIRFRHEGGAGGLGLLSRYPIVELEDLEPPSGWFPAWRVVIRGPFGPVQILAVHLRPPVSDSGSVVSGYFSTRPVRRAEISSYLERLDPDLPTLVAGDLNEANGQALALLESRGFTSAVPALRGSTPTWRWQTSMGTVRSQLDHVLVGRRLEALDARVLARGRSDHLPVVVLVAPATGS